MINNNMEIWCTDFGQMDDHSDDWYIRCVACKFPNENEMVLFHAEIDWANGQIDCPTIYLSFLCVWFGHTGRLAGGSRELNCSYLNQTMSFSHNTAKSKKRRLEDPDDDDTPVSKKSTTNKVTPIVGTVMI